MNCIVAFIIALGIFAFFIYRLIEKNKRNIFDKETKIKALNEIIIVREQELEAQQRKIETEKQKIKEKNKKLWKLSEAVYKEKKQVDEDNKKLTINQEKYKKKIQKLWEQSTSIHKEKERINNIKKEIEAIYKELSDSIDYAQRIQASILPNEKILKKYLSDFFVLFKPKDKVSGDFYWWTHIENHTIITAADSTGHGVPGAFMSMLGSSFLREVVQKEYITHTGVILRKLRKEIIKSLDQRGEQGEQKDGMDMAIISINHETNMVQFSGANNPLYVITNDELRMTNEKIVLFNNLEIENQIGKKLLYEVKPDKMPIAIYEKMDPFTTHEFQLKKGDMLYMFSDGFADQFGGKKGKKFKYKPFKQLLMDNCELTMEEQKSILEKTFEEWKGGLEQIDDVVVVGIKI